MPFKPASLLEPAYNDVFNTWKSTPSPENADLLLKSVDPIIKEGLRTYGGQASGSPTLRGKAKRLTLSALEVYDPTKAKLRTHLLTQLQGIRRAAAHELQPIHIPEQILLESNRMKDSELRLRDELGRDPSDTELADHSGLSIKKIARLRTIKPSFSEGQQIKQTQEGTQIFTPHVEQHSTQSAQSAWQNFVYHDLEPLDQLIMEHTLGLHGKQILSNQEVAKKLKLSPGAVSQRKLKLQEKLDLSSLAGIG